MLEIISRFVIFFEKPFENYKKPAVFVIPSHVFKENYKCIYS